MLSFLDTHLAYNVSLNQLQPLGFLVVNEYRNGCKSYVADAPAGDKLESKFREADFVLEQFEDVDVREAGGTDEESEGAGGVERGGEAWREVFGRR